MDQIDFQDQEYNMLQIPESEFSKSQAKMGDGLTEEQDKQVVNEDSSKSIAKEES